MGPANVWRVSGGGDPNLGVTTGMASTTLDSPVRHRRSLASVARAILRKDNYVGTIKAFLLAHRPVDFPVPLHSHWGFIPGGDIVVRSPTGPLKIRTYAPDDIQTINEIFFRGDYAFTGENKVVVDFGSNIGVSAIYFLSRHPEAFCYGYEPLPLNIERFTPT